jgi:hypothetical protein
LNILCILFILRGDNLRKKMTVNKLLKLSILSIALILFISFGLWDKKVQAFSSGPPAGHTDAPGEVNCTACHSSFPLNSGKGNVTINGLPIAYTPNQEVTVSVTTNQPDGFLYGFQLTAIDSTGAQAGTLVATDAVNTQLITGMVSGNTRQYIEQTFDGAFPTEFDKKTWTFKWIAPATNVGAVTFYAAGNGANGNHETTGDNIYTTSASIAFQSCIQDQSNGNVLNVNLMTGEYQFTNCHGVTLGGTAILTKKGCVVTLQHNSSSGRLIARIDTCAKTATATFQTFSPASTFTIVDKDSSNNTCACAVSN